MFLSATILLATAHLAATPVPTASSSASPAPSPSTPTTLIIESPFPVGVGNCPIDSGGGFFGHRVLVLDFDGDGNRDLAISEPGQDVVHVLLGPALDMASAIHIQPEGFFSGAPNGPSDFFGASLAAGEWNGLPGDELVIGATQAHGGRGEVHVYTNAGLLRRISSWRPGVRAFGTGVALADLDRDGRPDLAVGAGRTDVNAVLSVGTVHVFSTLLATERILVNPALSQGLGFRGQYGQKVQAADLDGDGWDELVVTAQGNAQPGQPFTGAVYVHPSPVVAPNGVPLAPPLRLDDPNVVPCDFGPRYGKGVDARDGLVAVSAQRKEPLGWTCPGGVQEDSGSAFLFSGTNFTTVEQLTDPTPSHEGLFGFDVCLLDMTGGPELEMAVVALEDRDVLLYDTTDLSQPPIVIPMPDGAAYWAFGIGRGDLFPATPKEELVLGDPRAYSCAGRVVVLGL